MDISLNTVLTEAYEISGGLQERLESIYPIECNLNFSGLPVMSLCLDHHEQRLKASASKILNLHSSLTQIQLGIF